MQAFERLIIVHLFSPNHYVIVLKYSFLLLLTPMIWILGYAQQAYWFQIDHFLLVFLKHGNSFRSENSWQNWNRHCCWGLLTLHFHREIKRCLTSQRACYFETLLSLCDIRFFFCTSLRGSLSFTSLSAVQIYDFHIFLTVYTFFCFLGPCFQSLIIIQMRRQLKNPLGDSHKLNKTFIPTRESKILWLRLYIAKSTCRPLAKKNQIP